MVAPLPDNSPPPAYSELPTCKDEVNSKLTTAFKAEIPFPNPHLRDPSSVSSRVNDASPTTQDFGWQMALQKPAAADDGKETATCPNGGTQGVSEDRLVDPSSPSSVTGGHLSPSKARPSRSSHTSIAQDHHVETSTEPSELARRKSRIKRYKSKDIGWQLALQVPPAESLDVSTAQKVQEVKSWTDSKPLDLAAQDKGKARARDGESLLEEAPSSIWGTISSDKFRSEGGANPQSTIAYPVLDLDSAARAFSSFAVDDSELPPPAPRAQDNRPPDNFSSGSSSSSSSRIRQPQQYASLSKGTSPDVNVLLSDLKQGPQWDGVSTSASWSPTAAQPTSQRMPHVPMPKSEMIDAVQTSFKCEDCRANFEVDELAQVPGCGHLVCMHCVVSFVHTEIRAKGSPGTCPVCVEQGRPEGVLGELSEDILRNCPVDPKFFELFQEMELAKHSTRMWCPSCDQTMLIDSEEYFESRTIVCPLNGCGHRFCKVCLRTMPVDLGKDNHKCGVVKLKDWKPCPACGTLGRSLVAANSHIKCKGLGCRTHFCLCGESIGDELQTDDIDSDILEHYRRCKLAQKRRDASGKSCIIM